MKSEDYKKSLESCLALSPRDWSTDRHDAWIYGIVCGWDAETIREIAQKHGWTKEIIEQLNQLHFSFCST